MTFLIKFQRIALYLFFISINFEMWDPFNSQNTFSIAKLTALIYFISIIPQFRQFIRIDALKPVLFPIWIFFGLLTIMSAFNVNELSTEFFYTSIFLNMTFFWLLINHARKDYLILEKGMLSFALGSFALTVLFFAGIGVTYVDKRLSMFGENSNVLGVMASLSTLILLANAIQNRLNMGWYRYIFVLMIFPMLIFIGESGSRVAIIAFVMAFLTGTILYKTKSKVGKAGILIGSAVILILAGIMLMQSEVMVQRLENTSNSGEIGSRDRIWKAVFPIIENNPVLGVGRTGYDFESTFLFGRPFSPHNVILEIMCYTGIVGLLIYLYFLFQVYNTGYQTYKRNGWLLPILLAIPISGLILSGQILQFKIGWTIFAYIVGSICAKAYNDKINYPKRIGTNQVTSKV